MPTVLRQRGFEVKIYVSDHLPRHVHVFYAGTSIVINLDDLAVRDVRGMKAHDAHDAWSIVKDNQEFLLSEWERIKPVP